MRTGKLWAAFRPYLWITLASAVFALGFDWCYVPNQITLGGMTGLGQIIHAIVPAIPVGSAVIALNLPLFLLGWRFIGGHLLVTSLYAMFVSSLMIDGMTALAGPFRPMEPLLACIYGGVLMGAGMAVVFLRGSTTGGSDIVSRVLQLRYPYIPLGRILMSIDVVVILISAAVFGRIETALYGMVAVFTASKVIDGILYGMDTGKLIYVMSRDSQTIAKRVMAELERGCTLLKSTGAFTQSDAQVLLVAVRRQQYHPLKKICLLYTSDAADE